MCDQFGKTTLIEMCDVFYILFVKQYLFVHEQYIFLVQAGQKFGWLTTSVCVTKKTEDI